jgi:hypothetical protein
LIHLFAAFIDVLANLIGGLTSACTEVFATFARTLGEFFAGFATALWSIKNAD